MELYQQEIANKPLFPILFYLDEAEQFTEGKHYQLHAHKPNVSTLAESAGMSISKLQKSFKQVFGKIISQYCLHEKIQIPKD